MESFEELHSRPYLSAMLDTLSDMVRVVTREGKIAYANRAYTRNLAYGCDVTGHYCYEMYGYKEACRPCITRDVMSSGKMRQVTRELNGRKYSVTASPLKDPETGKTVAVMETFRDITLDLNIRNNLVSQTSKLQQDLQLARKVQQALIKGVLPRIDGYELYASYKPCEAVGGDMYDVFVTGDKLVMYVADACGHGVTPSMLGVFFSRAVHAANIMGITDPPEILAYVQSEFEGLKVDPSLYITGFVLVIDIPTGHYRYSNAGLSVAPVQCHEGKVEELIMSSPPVSLWFEDPEFGVSEGDLFPGDRILIYTDGLGDVQVNPDGLKELYDQFSQQNFSSDSFVRYVLTYMHTRPTDDLTVLICARTHAAPGASVCQTS